MSDTVHEAPGTHEPEGRKTPRKAALAAWIGSALEYYDFFIYATAASLIFPDIFFPKGNPAVATVASFATFGVGYVARPIGSFFMGHWGDKYGRKRVLLFTLFLMGGATFLVGCLPTYDQVGIWAPVLLVTLRLIQGFAVSGEQSNANAMVIEHAPYGRRGFFASFTLQGTQAGQIISTGIFLPLAAVLPNDALEGWGWRVPFWLSVIVVAVGYYIRRSLDETPAFTEEAVQGEVPRAPLAVAFQDYWPRMLNVFLMTFVNAVAVTLGIYALSYATSSANGIGISRTTMLWVGVLVNVVALATIPVVGGLSDRVGRRPVFIAGTLSAGALMWAYLYVISIRNVPMVFLVALLMSGVLYSGYNAVFPSFWPELFPTKARVAGVAVASQWGFAVTGFIPTIEAVLARPGAPHSEVIVRVGLTVTAFCVLAALGAFFAPETAKVHLNDLGRRRQKVRDASGALVTP